MSDVIDSDLEKSGKEGESQGFVSREEMSKEMSKTVSARVNEVTATLTAKHDQEIDELKQKFESLKDKPKVYTRAELNALVADSKITDAEGQAIFDRQQSEATQEVAAKTAADTVTELHQTNKIQNSIAKYTNFDPELLANGSDSRMRIEKEIQKLMGIYNQSKVTLSTELAALNAVYGDEDKLNAKLEEHERETHQDSATGGGSDLTLNKDGWPKGLSTREKKYYQKHIDAGRMTMKQVAEEQEHANSGIRKRAAARA